MIERSLALEDSADRLELTAATSDDEDVVLVVRIMKASGGGSGGRYVGLDSAQVEALVDFAGDERRRWLRARKDGGPV